MNYNSIYDANTLKNISHLIRILTYYYISKIWLFWLTTTKTTTFKLMGLHQNGILSWRISEFLWGRIGVTIFLKNSAIPKFKKYLLMFELSLLHFISFLNLRQPLSCVCRTSREWETIFYKPSLPNLKKKMAVFAITIWRRCIIRTNNYIVSAYRVKRRVKLSICHTYWPEI